ncbi:ricin-type beta-trefoil lectin domain protein [Kitasatospora sp. NPDC093806]|uniref:ricin-type beta-trefoil lectin domain protein n=1 Tax=Kitasatospora sp. NPDC093806 TaxID=3155075 RepID=UPI00343AE5D8
MRAGTRTGPPYWRRVRSAAVAAALAVTATLVGTGVVGPAAAPALAVPPPNAPTAIVSIGDSFISGEAGRWKGNGSDAFTALPEDTYTVDGKDTYFKTGNACDRSKFAEIVSNAIPVDAKINLACSGAVTDNVLEPPVAEGRPEPLFKGEPSQTKQLREKAQNYRVKLIVVSIGGNDIHFSDIIKACVTSYLNPTPIGSDCPASRAAEFEKDINELSARVGNVLDGITGVMRGAGYQPWDYKLLLQSYPTPIPTPNQYRYPASGPRFRSGGCPFSDAASEWAVNTIIPRLRDTLTGVARNHNGYFMDLSDAFAGHELCRMGTLLTTDPAEERALFAEEAEWIRWIPATWDALGGAVQEAIHPNYFGQQALGKCLEQFWNATTVNPAGSWLYTCRNRGSGPQTMVVDASEVGGWGQNTERRAFALSAKRTAAYYDDFLTGHGFNQLPDTLTMQWRQAPENTHGQFVVPAPRFSLAQMWSMEQSPVDRNVFKLRQTDRAVTVSPDGLNVELQANSDADPGQVWRAENAGGGRVFLRNSLTQTCLYTRELGRPPGVRPCDGATDQQWSAHPIRDTRFEIGARAAGGGCLGSQNGPDLRGGPADTGACNETASRWWSADAPPGDTVPRTPNGNPGLAATTGAPATGAGMATTAGTSTAATTASTSTASTASAASLTADTPALIAGPIINLKAEGECLGTGGGTGGGTPVGFEPCSGAPTQAWRSLGEGQLMHVASGRCLSNPVGGAQGVPLSIADCAPVDAQFWVVLDELPPCGSLEGSGPTPPDPTPGDGQTPAGMCRSGNIPRASGASVSAAYSFLAGAQDKYAANGALGVPQSYTGGFFSSPQFGPDGYQASFTYDNSVVIAALLTRRQAGDLARAQALGDSLLYAQDHDRTPDGRLRASYEPNPFVTRTGAPYVGGFSVYTGNTAWIGMAFTRLYDETGDQRYLAGALKAADWIQRNAADGRGVGGYTGGFRDEDGTGAIMTRLTWKATEHNIDVGAFFAMLAKVTGDQTWRGRSDNAFGFVRSMQADDGRLWTGTGLDGVTQNRDTVPEDIQTWSYLATLDPRYAVSIDWAATNLAASDGGFTGVSFGRSDTSKVWFEGTAHLLAAYNVRRAPGDFAKAGALLDSLQRAQGSAPNTDGKGLVAASSDGLITGEGDTYYAALHTGATAWYLLGALGGNPFRL